LRRLYREKDKLQKRADDAKLKGHEDKYLSLMEQLSAVDKFMGSYFTKEGGVRSFDDKTEGKIVKDKIDRDIKYALK